MERESSSGSRLERSRLVTRGLKAKEGSADRTVPCTCQPLPSGAASAADLPPLALLLTRSTPPALTCCLAAGSSVDVHRLVLQVKDQYIQKQQYLTECGYSEPSLAEPSPTRHSAGPILSTASGESMRAQRAIELDALHLLCIMGGGPPWPWYGLLMLGRGRQAPAPRRG